MKQTMVERCALSGSDLKIKFRAILFTSIGMSLGFGITFFFSF